MRRLRIVTTVLLLLGVGLLLSYPFTVGPKPAADDSAEAKRSYVTRMMLVFTGASFALLGAATGAMLLARRIRRDFAERSLKNLANLLSEQADKKGPDGG